MTGQFAMQHSNLKRGSCRTISRRSRTWRFIDAEIVERTGLGKEETAVLSDRHLVVLNLKGASEQGQYTLNGRSATFVQRRPGALLFIPAGCDWRGWEAGASTAAYLSISIDPTLIATLCADLPDRSALTLSPDLGFEDPVIMNAAQGIAGEITTRNPLSMMVTEAYIATIFAQLLRKDRHTVSMQKGGLTRSHLHHILELIDENAISELSLSEMADQLGLSVPHFCRAFRQSVGYPPHTFIVRRRIERAQGHLRSTALSITDIALSCGFSSSSHFSNTFRRITGMTPLDYRSRWNW
ncbi:AraC family transcriptional regulator [Neorhizobium sp. NCHU2750]|uniref:helix-turn-helix domain-containing protein n=1 Tax=Neorhizobium sp. NCHU2750 TaxID=1825976 RepID=UPI000E768D7C|nr:AraC family transcriptional regulator [Neorhizobium sp. NCHU2750]